MRIVRGYPKPSAPFWMGCTKNIQQNDVLEKLPYTDLKTTSSSVETIAFNYCLIALLLICLKLWKYLFYNEIFYGKVVLKIIDERIFVVMQGDFFTAFCIFFCLHIILNANFLYKLIEDWNWLIIFIIMHCQTSIKIKIYWRNFLW